MSNYWQERFIEEEKRVNDLATDEIKIQQLEYEKSLAKINRDIEVWYGRIAKNNEVSLAEAKQLLNAKELKEFKWTLEEYIKYGKENGISGDWSKQLENASARVHIERLEALKLQVRGQIEKLYNGRESGFESYLKNIYKDQYNHTAFQIAKGTGVGTNLYKLNDKLIGEVIKKPWAPDGKNFSERIWGDKNRLINTLHTELTQGFIRGDSIKEMTANISKKMNVSKSNVERLVRTESAAYASKAKQQSFIDLDVEKFEVVATLDTRTSEICQHLDGKVFDMKDYEVGLTAPPYHPSCRSVTAPYFEDEEDDTRAMRNPETGKTEYVPVNMKYKEWEERYLKDRVDTDSIEIEKIGRKVLEELERKLPRITKEKEELVRERENITIFKATGTKNNIYMEQKTKGTLKIDGDSNKISVKKATEFIDNTLSKSFEIMEMKESDFGDLKTVIMIKENKFASYDPNKNIMYINPLSLGSKSVYDSLFRSGVLKQLTNSDNILSNYIHELAHAYEKKYYKKYHKNKDISKIRKEKLDAILDFIEEKGYNIENKISLYAYENKKDISELLAEAYTKKKLGKTNLLIEYILDLFELGDD